MPGAEYAQLSSKNDVDEEEVVAKRPLANWQENPSHKMVLSLMMVLLYFSLSIGLTFYQRWLLQNLDYPLTVVMYHLVVKWVLSVIIRTIIYIVTGSSQLWLPLMTCLKSVGPTGLASGIDVGFSNWGLALVTISLYTMTKSTTIIFILIFAILLRLEKKSWSLVGIVCTISTGLIMFTYKATQFNPQGFCFLLLASFAAGLRWTFAQHLMQKSKLGLHNPVDMVFHVQPWMFISLLPFVVLFEGLGCFHHLNSMSSEVLMKTVLKVSVGAYIAFAMELSEFLVVTYTSSLTLSIAGIFKEMCILVLAVKVSGDQLSGINVVGLVVCLLGIAGHVLHKLLVIRRAEAAAETRFNYKHNRALQFKTNHHEPLLQEEPNKSESDTDIDTSVVLFEVVQRRDGI